MRDGRYNPALLKDGLIPLAIELQTKSTHVNQIGCVTRTLGPGVAESALRVIVARLYWTWKSVHELGLVSRAYLSLKS